MSLIEASIVWIMLHGFQFTRTQHAITSDCQSHVRRAATWCRRSRRSAACWHRYAPITPHTTPHTWQCRRLPVLHSSMLGLEISLGKDQTIDFQDYLNGSPVPPHTTSTLTPHRPARAARDGPRARHD